MLLLFLIINNKLTQFGTNLAHKSLIKVSVIASYLN